MTVHVPTLNAALNGLSAALLVAGYVFIRRGNVAAHRAAMVSAFAVSVVFLASYLAYHFQHGATRFAGTGWSRRIYFPLLISHTFLATAMAPFILVTLRRAWRGDIAGHRALARFTLPVWLYVSVTGVAVTWMLYYR